MARTLLRPSIVTAGIIGLAMLVGIPDVAWRISGAVLMAASAVALERLHVRTGNRQRDEIRELARRVANLESQAIDPDGFVQRSSKAVDTLVETVDLARSRTDATLAEVTARLERIAEEFPLVGRKLSSIAESIPSTEKQLAERINAFAQGILEEVAQTQLDADRHARTAERHRDEISQNVEALIAIYTVLQPDRPYPAFGGWAVSADAARRLLSAIYSSRPRTVVDVGSGTSTLLSARVLEAIGEDGRIVALEHDDTWASQTRHLIAEHGLDHRATVIHAPLVEYRLGDEVFQWYDLDDVEFPSEIDVLFVDGPPKSTGDLARYPALPLLKDHLAPKAVIFMDDAGRPEEQEVVSRWLEEYPEWTATMHKDEKGTAELRRVGS